MMFSKLIIGAINGSSANFIKDNELGYACASGDANALANIIKELDAEDLSNKGKQAKNIYLNKYSKLIFIDLLSKELNKYSQ